MAHIRKDPITGHMMKTPSGHIAKMTTCVNCDNDYCQYTIVVSGMTFCTNCVVHSLPFTGSSNVPVPPTYVNGIWTVTRTANPCIWAFTEAGAFGTKFAYLNNTCASVGNAIPLVAFSIRLVKTGLTTWSLLIAYLDFTSTVVVRIFDEAWVVPSGNCEATAVTHSQNVCPAVPPPGESPLKTIFSKNGIVTVDPVV